MPDPKIEIVDISTLLPNQANHNAGTERGNAAIATSVSGYGLHRGIAIAADNQAFAGSHILQAASDAGIQEVIIVETTGNQLVATRRADFSTAQDPKAIAAAIADNRTNQLNFTLDAGQFAADMAILAEAGEDLPAVFYTEDETTEKLKELLQKGEGGDRDPGGFYDDGRPVTVFLSSAEFKEWNVIKETAGSKNDKVVFLQLMRGEL